MKTLRQFFEYYQAFSRYILFISISFGKIGNIFRIDEDNDRRISKEEFTSRTIKKTIEKVNFSYFYFYFHLSLQWVGPLGDMKAEFEAIDTNHGGYILFSEFISWASKKNLDLEDDIDELVD